jgi:hypothetical protein
MRVMRFPRGDDGLDVQNVLSAIAQTNTEVATILHRNANQTRDGILRRVS